MAAEGGGGFCRGGEVGGLFSEVGKGDGDCCTGVEVGGLVSEVGEGEGISSAREELLLGGGKGGLKFFVKLGPV